MTRLQYDNITLEEDFSREIPSLEPSQCEPQGPQLWREQLDDAIHERDERSIWQIMYEQQHNGAALSALADQVSRMCFEANGRQYYCELFMMPVAAAPGTDVVGNNDVWEWAGKTVMDSLRKWFPKNARMLVFNGIQPMDWVMTWTPKILRSHLSRCLPNAENRKIEFPSETIDLPDDAPRLGFLTMACVSERQWTTIPESNTLNNNRLKILVSHTLQVVTPYGKGMAPAPAVLIPERVQHAVTDGIGLWLLKLNEAVGITGYMVQPSLVAIDVVKVTLLLDSETVKRTQFTLRLHQIGLQGLTDILQVLAQISLGG